MNYRLYNDTLCPDLWDKKGDTYKLKPDVRKNLLQIVSDLKKEKFEDEGVKIKFADVIMVGSSTNYNWTQYSDIDVHILVELAKMDMKEEEATTMLDAIKSNWNKKHAIKIKGHDIEISFTDINHKGSVSSIYSLKSNKWLEPPVKDNPSFNKELIKSKHTALKQTIDKILKDGTEEELKRVLEKLYMMRQAGLDRKGEMSEENIIFKILRAQGYVDKLKDHAVKLYDKAMTLNEMLFDKPEDRYHPEDKAEYAAAVARSKAMAQKLGKPYNDSVGDDAPPEDNHIDGEDMSMIGEISIEPLPNYPDYKFIVFKIAYMFNRYIEQKGHCPSRRYVKAVIQELSHEYSFSKEVVTKDLFVVMEFLRRKETDDNDELGGQPSED